MVIVKRLLLRRRLGHEKTRVVTTRCGDRRDPVREINELIRGKLQAFGCNQCCKIEFTGIQLPALRIKARCDLGIGQRHQATGAVACQQ